MTAFHVFLAGLVVIVVVRLLQHSRRCSSSEELDTIRCLPSFSLQQQQCCSTWQQGRETTAICAP